MFRYVTNTHTHTRPPTSTHTHTDILFTYRKLFSFYAINTKLHPATLFGVLGYKVCSTEIETLSYSWDEKENGFCETLSLGELGVRTALGGHS